jgi:hypothetical protein
MPLEIREIGINMRVGSDDVAPEQDAADEGDDAEARDAIVQDCVRRVLAILRTRRER